MSGPCAPTTASAHPAVAADQADDSESIVVADHVDSSGHAVAMGAAAGATPVTDEDGAEVLAMEAGQLRAAAAETVAPAASTVHAAGAGTALLASLPVIGPVLSGRLPFTGANTLVLLFVAMAAMAIGFLLDRTSRPASSTAS